MDLIISIKKGLMTVTVNNANIDFKKCLRGIDSNVESNVWKAFIEIDNERIEFEVINECEICNSTLNADINWKGVVDFLEKLPTYLKDIKSAAQTNLLYLAKQMDFWRDEFEKESFFHLDAIEYLSVNLSSERLTYPRFENHSFQMVFSLETKENPYLDIYGRWITKWIGNQITGIMREQR